MGLYVHSLAELPLEAHRAYYVYLLDYGWEENLGEAVRKNLPRMTDIASRHNAVVIHGPRGLHFEDEVLSWHHINGEAAGNILPAILVTTRHPADFKDHPFTFAKSESNDAMLLIPLKKVCATADDVVDLVNRVFSDIREKKELTQFSVAREMHKGVGRAFVDAVVLEPNLSGIGFNFKKFFGSR